MIDFGVKLGFDLEVQMECGLMPVFEQPTVDIPGLMLVYCKDVKVINPFDTFVAMKGIHLPGMDNPMFPFFELVVREVFENGQVRANMYDVREGERVFSQVANFAPPHSLIDAVHLGLFIPQSFFLQFTDGRAVHEIDQSDLERGQAN